jgi:hypothetical protein
MNDAIISRFILFLLDFLALDDNKRELFIGRNQDLIILGFEAQEFKFIGMVEVSDRGLSLSSELRNESCQVLA